MGIARMEATRSLVKNITVSVISATLVVLILVAISGLLMLFVNKL